MIKITILTIILFSLIVRNSLIDIGKNKLAYFFINFAPYIIFGLFFIKYDVTFFKFFITWAFGFVLLTTVIEYSEKQKLLFRLICSTIFWLILLLYPWNIEIQIFNEYVYTAVKYIVKTINERLSVKFDLQYLLIISTGAFFVATEANYIIKYILNNNMTVYQNNVPKEVVPGESSTETDAKGKEIEVELRRGKIIGAIERMMIFFFVIVGEYSAIAFIIAAKSIARFKELDDKEFAEYFLIGTLLSTAVATLTGILFKSLI